MTQVESDRKVNGTQETAAGASKPERLITADEVAALINISPKSIYRWASEGRLPSFREGRVIRFLASDVEAFIRSRIGAGARGMD
jgi:excisionase family DNA binding protein